ncbi:UDP-4-amino-4-deoxy-L-arabinose aminotransferase [soil metagenome]
MPVAHSASDISSADQAAVQAVLAENFPGTGPRVDDLERSLALRTTRNFCSAVQSGFQGLVLALRSLDLPPMSHVALPALTCSSVASAILNAGLVPSLCDIRDDLTIDPATVSSSCRAVVAPHAYGAPADVDALQKLGLPWIEDCATSPATRVGRKLAGSFGTLSVFSFAGTKYLTGGNGGAVLCDEQGIAARIRDLLSIDFLDCSPSWKHNQPLPFPGKMSNLQAALVSSQLTRVDSFLKHRASLASLYLDHLRGCPGLILPANLVGHSWYRFVVRTSAPALPLVRQMQAGGWDIRDSVNPWLHRHYLSAPAERASLPLAQALEGHIISLPIHLQVSETDASALARALRAALEHSEKVSL